MVTGPYEPIQTVGPAESGPATLFFFLTDGQGFFVVEQVE